LLLANGPKNNRIIVHVQAICEGELVRGSVEESVGTVAMIYVIKSRAEVFYKQEFVKEKSIFLN
jgi:hypothetical protein